METTAGNDWLDEGNQGVWTARGSVVDVTTKEDNDWFEEGTEHVWTARGPFMEVLNNDRENVSRARRRPRGRQARTKHRQGVPSKSYRYLSGVAITCLALLTAYSLHRVHKNSRILSKEVHETHKPLGDDEKSAKATPERRRENEALLSRDDSPGQTDEDGKAKSFVLKNQTPSMQHDTQSDSTELLRGVAFSKVVSRVLGILPLLVHAVVYAAAKVLTFVTAVIEAIDRSIHTVVQIGDLVMAFSSILWSAMKFSLTIVSVYLVIFALNAAYPVGLLHVASSKVFGEALGISLHILRWLPHASLLVSYVLLAVYRSVVHASTRDLLSKVIGILMAYAAQLHVAELLPTPFSDALLDVPLSSVSYTLALATFFIMDAFRKGRAHLFLVGWLTIYSLFLTAKKLIPSVLPL